jgi:hypothetical protein
MSSMLEQAIEDANALKEAALQMAERQIVEKYSDDVRKACDRLIEGSVDEFGLEEDPLADADLDLDLDPAAGEAVALSPEDVAVIDNIPAAYGPGSPSDDDMIELDLNDIKHIMQDQPSDPMGHEELAASIGVPALDEPNPADPAESEDLEDPEEYNFPANRDDEIQIDEAELVNIFKEMLSVDVEVLPESDEVDQSEPETVEEEDNQFPLSVKDGTDAKDREINELKTQVDSATERNNRLEEILRQAKGRLEEVNLSNARLFYINRIVTDTSYNERQKTMFAETISKAETVVEAKVIYETLHKTTAAKSKRGQVPKSLSEAITRSSSSVIGPSRGNETQADPTRNRWAKLAGLAGK